jgi:antitoxin VapB
MDAGEWCIFGGRYHRERLMAGIAKIFQHGRSQAVRLPKEFRLPGTEVKVSRVGDAVLLEPISKKAPFDSEAFWARIDALSGGAEFPYVTDDDLRPELDGEVNFDELNR